MKKTLVSVLAAAVLILGGITGCAGTSGSGSTDTSESAAAAETGTSGETAVETGADGETAEEAAGSSGNSSDAASEESVTVRLSYWNFNIHGSLLLAAQEFGIWDEVFGDSNVELELIPFENGPTANESVTAGELDGELSIGDQPIITGNANGVDTTILCTTLKNERSYVTVVAADSEIESYADLKGKNIGVGIGTFSHKAVIGILEDYGIGESDVEFTNLGDVDFGEALTAIERGELDAYFGPWQSLAEALEEGTVKQIGDATGHPLTNYFVMTNAFVEEHPDVTEKLVEVLYRTVEYINADKAKAAEYFSGLIGIDADTLEELLNKAEFVVGLTDEDIASIQQTQQFLVAHDILDEEVDALIEEHTNASFAQEVCGEN